MAHSIRPGDAIVAVLALFVFVASAACGDPESPEVIEPTRATENPSATRTSIAPSAVPSSETSSAVAATVMPETAPAGTQPPAPGATPLPPMDAAEIPLKYVLLDRFGDLWWCDPDFYPIAREDEQVLAEQRFPEIERDAPAFGAIIGRLGIPPAGAYTPGQKLAVYRDWKVLRALELLRTGDVYEFNDRFTHDDQTGVLVSGTIDRDGRITVISEDTAEPPMCPICLARGTLIATPDGEIPVEELRPGMAVWTTTADGARLPAEVLAVGMMPVPASHRVTRLVLTDGRSLRASPAHPLADGRLLGAIAPGDIVDGSLVLSARTEAYDGGATFDILPSGPTGSYWANGVLLGTTLGANASATP